MTSAQLALPFDRRRIDITLERIDAQAKLLSDEQKTRLLSHPHWAIIVTLSRVRSMEMAEDDVLGRNCPGLADIYDAVVKPGEGIAHLSIRLSEQIGVACMRTLSVAEFHAELKAQGVSSHEHFAFVCPACRTIQSSRDLIAAGAGKTFDEVEKYIAFSCVGRFTGAGAHKRGDVLGKGCDWTLGGLFRIHKLAVETPEGEMHPRFEIASPEAAQAHERLTSAQALQSEPSQ